MLLLKKSFLLFSKKFLLTLFVLLLAIGIQQKASATSINPLDDGGWNLVAHMSNTGGMFDGNGNLAATYSYGSFVASPVASTPDFQRIFPVVADEILFMTGDLSVWGIADYGDLMTRINALDNNQAPNIAFEVYDGTSIFNTTGNVLSRSTNPEDPWISIDGSHSDGITNSRIVWGENDYNAGTHQSLKNTHDGLNVFVRAATVPEPATMILFGFGLLGLAGVSRRKK